MVAEEVIAQFGMTRLPIESVYYRRTYTSAALAADGSAASSAIIGLLSEALDSRSLFHRLSCDEMWHFYAGGPFRVITLRPDGSRSQSVLGPDLSAGHVVQHHVPAGVWQAAEALPGSDWALFGCTVTPEFHPDRFESGFLDELLPQYPGASDDLRRLAVRPGEPRRMPALGE